MSKYIEIHEIRCKEDEKRKFYIYVVRYMNIIVAGPRIAHGSVLAVINKAITGAHNGNIYHYNGYSVSKYTIKCNLMEDFEKKVNEQKEEEKEKLKDGQKEIVIEHGQSWTKGVDMEPFLDTVNEATKGIVNTLTEYLAKVNKLAEVNELAEAKKLAKELAEELDYELTSAKELVEEQTNAKKLRQT